MQTFSKVYLVAVLRRRISNRFILVISSDWSIKKGAPLRGPWLSLLDPGLSGEPLINPAAVGL
jgi:hypothetical protein